MPTPPLNCLLVSIVCPMHNEAAGVAAFYRAISALFARLPDVRFELICVDDGSTDETLTELIALSQQDDRLKVIELSRNFGKEAALSAGITAATGDAVIPMDADLQHPPEVILQLIAAWQGGFDVVLARRINRGDEAFFKRISAGLFYRLHNRISSISIPDNVGDLRLLNRSAVDALELLPEQQRFMKGLFAWIGFKTTVIDYTHAPRAYGESKFSAWKLWNFALDGITSFSTAPLKIWTYIGALGALIALTYGGFIVLRTLIHGVDVPGYASLLVAILFFGSLQLIGIGVLGEYIGRIYIESKRRPPYLIRSTFNLEQKKKGDTSA